MAQKAEILGVLQSVEIGRIAIELSHKETDRARILLAPVDQELLFVALGFESDARQFHVEHDRDGGSHGEDEQDREAGFADGFLRQPHPPATAGSGCS